MSGSAEYICRHPDPAMPMVDPETGGISEAWNHWAIQIFRRTGNQAGIGSSDVQSQAIAAQNTADAATAATATETATRISEDNIIKSGIVPGQYNATATNDNAAAGKGGEIITSTVLVGGALALTTTVALNITSIALTAGDWDVSSAAFFTGNAATTVTTLQSSISSATGTLQTVPGQFSTAPGFGLAAFSFTNPIVLNVIPWRVSLAAPATIFLVVSATFAVNTCSGYGIIRARRVR